MNNEHRDGEMTGQDDEGRMYDLLCRYVFDEASEAEKDEVEAALAASEELRAQKAELDATVALVQGAMGEPDADEPATLSPAHMEALQAAALEKSQGAASADYELKPVAPKGRPWYREPVVSFAAAAAVLVGVGLQFTSPPDEGGAGYDLGGGGGSVYTESATMAYDSELAAAAPESSASAAAKESLQGIGYLSAAWEEAHVPASAEPRPTQEEQAAFDLIDESRAPKQPMGDAQVWRLSVPASAAEPAPVAANELVDDLALGRGVAESGPSSPGPSGPSTPGAAAGPTSGGGMSLAAREQLASLGYGGGAAGGSASDSPFDSANSNARLGAPRKKAPGARGRRSAASRDDVQVLRKRRGERPRDMFFRFWGDNPFVPTRNDGLSTFAADVDTASFALARRMLREGVLPGRDQIRTEEFVNFAKPDLAPPSDPDLAGVPEGDFAVYGELAPSPFGGREDRWLLRVGVRARDIDRDARPPLSLTFVVDTSGSMRTDNRLELVKHALRLLVDQLDGRDSIAIVGFSNEAREVLPPTPATARDVIETALFGLQPDGGTNAEAGLRLGYSLGLSGAVNPEAQRRVVFLSDGVANIGQTDQDRLAQEVSAYSDQGIFLNTIGVGMGNHSDVFLEQLANKGQGVCDYVGDAADARRAIVERFISGFVTVAKDLKIQVEFDGETVLRWRQLGYENRAVADRDFRNDKVDAGEIGAGHQVTCFYEVELASGAAGAEAALAKVRLRWKSPKAIVLGVRTTETNETETALAYGAIVAPSFRAASPGFRLGALSAQFAELLRRSYHARGDSLDGVARGLANLLSDAPSPDVASVGEAFQLARKLGLTAPPAIRPTDADAGRQAAYYQSLIESLGGADSAGPGEELQPQSETGTPRPEGAAQGPQTLDEYERRIRELLNGDPKKGEH